MPLTLADFERDALETLSEFGNIPCLSPMFDERWDENGHIEAAAQLLADWARQRRLAGADVEIHRLPGRTPVLTVTVPATGPGQGTCVLYGHLDKQPPLGDWSEGLDPFVPVRRGDRLYGRGMADDGYAVFAALLALESLEDAGTPHARCVVLIEASEESASSDLDAYLDALSDHLGAVELLVCLDSGALTYDRLWVTSSLRGNVNVRVKVEVVPLALHSGLASGVVPSSFRVLRQLLDRVEDSATGEVLLESLHAEIPPAHVAAAEALTSEFGDVCENELAVLDGVRLMGETPAERQLAPHVAPRAVDHRHGRHPGPGDRGQRAAHLDHRRPVDAPAAVGLECRGVGHAGRRAQRGPARGRARHRDHRLAGRRLDRAARAPVAQRRPGERVARRVRQGPWFRR